MGRANRSRLLVAGGVVTAAVLCGVGIVMGARYSGIEAVSEVPGSLGEYALGSVLDKMRPGVEREQPVQQIKYGYMNAKSPHYDTYLRTQANYLHNQQVLGLSPALDRARQSQNDMTTLVNYYAQRSPAVNPAAYTVCMQCSNH